MDADRKLFRDLDRKLLRRRVAEITEGDWMRETLSEAVETAAAAAPAAAPSTLRMGTPEDPSDIPTQHPRAGSDPVTPSGPGWRQVDVTTIPTDS